MSSSPSLPLPELRAGEWTRFGNNAVLGDAVTEETLSTLAESTRVAASSQGYAVGWAQGQRAAREAAAVEAAAVRAAHDAAEAARASEHAAALSALHVATRQLQEAAVSATAAIEDQASGLAWELTRELVGHELSGPGIDVVRRVLALVPADLAVRVRLHPDDLPAEPSDVLTWVPDPTLARGDALVETEDHLLDLRLEPALQRLREALQ